MGDEEFSSKPLNNIIERSQPPGITGLANLSSDVSRHIRPCVSSGMDTVLLEESGHASCVPPIDSSSPTPTGAMVYSDVDGADATMDTSDAAVVDDKLQDDFEKLLCCFINRAPGKREVRPVQDNICELALMGEDSEEDEDFVPQENEDHSDVSTSESEPSDKPRPPFTESIQDNTPAPSEEQLKPVGAGRRSLRNRHWLDLSSFTAADGCLSSGGPVSPAPSRPRKRSASSAVSEPTRKRGRPSKTQKEDAERMKSVCSVCLEYTPLHEDLMECDVCGIVVHQGCYGFHGEGSSNLDTDKTITEAWFCDLCKANIASKECELCPVAVGPMKPTKDGRWVHVVCGLYVRDVWCEDIGKEMVFNLDYINPTVWNSRVCLFCEDRSRAKSGVCVKCNHRKCEMYFHATCGLGKGLLLEDEEGKPNPEGRPLFALCPEHNTRENTLSKMLHWKMLQRNPRVMPKHKRRDILDVYTESKARFQLFLHTLCSQRVSAIELLKKDTKRKTGTPSNSAAVTVLASSTGSPTPFLNPEPPSLSERPTPSGRARRLRSHSPAGASPNCKYHAPSSLPGGPSQTSLFSAVPKTELPSISETYSLYFSEREKVVESLSCSCSRFAAKIDQLERQLRSLHQRHQESLEISKSNKLEISSLLVELNSLKAEHPGIVTTILRRPRKKGKRTKRRVYRLSRPCSRKAAARRKLPGCCVCRRRTHPNNSVSCDMCGRSFHFNTCLNPTVKVNPKTKFWGWICEDCAEQEGTTPAIAASVFPGSTLELPVSSRKVESASHKMEESCTDVEAGELSRKTASQPGYSVLGDQGQLAVFPSWKTANPIGPTEDVPGSRGLTHDRCLLSGVSETSEAQCPVSALEMDACKSEHVEVPMLMSDGEGSPGGYTSSTEAALPIAASLATSQPGAHHKFPAGTSAPAHVGYSTDTNNIWVGVGPNITDEGMDSNIISEGTSTDAIDESVDSNIVNESTSNNIIDEGTSTNIIDEGMGSNIAYEGTSTNIGTEGTNTDIIDEGIDSSIADEGSSTNIFNESTSTDVIDEGIGSNIANEGTSTNVVNEGMGPDFADEGTSTSVVNGGTSTNIIGEGMGSITANKGTDSNIASEGSSPDIVDNDMSSNIADEGTSTSVVNGSTSTNIIDEGMGSIIANKGMDSNITSEGSSPDIVDKDMSSNIADEGTSTSVVNGSTSTNIIDEGMGSVIINKGMDSNITSEGSSPDIVDKGMGSNIADEGTSTNIVNKRMDSNIADEGTSTSVVNGGTSTNIIDEGMGSIIANKGTDSNIASEGTSTNVIKQGMDSNYAIEGTGWNTITDSFSSSSGTCDGICSNKAEGSINLNLVCGGTGSEPSETNLTTTLVEPYAPCFKNSLSLLSVSGDEFRSSGRAMGNTDTSSAADRQQEL